MPHTTGSILTLTVLIILFVSTSSYYIITVGLRLLGWYLLRQSETRRNAVLDELAEAERKHGGGVMKKEEALVVGFFHPFCNAGGGGERVLWAAIRATQDRYPNAICVVYTGDHEVDSSSMLNRIRGRFSISLDSNRIIFIYISHRRLVNPTLYPHFTLILQSLGSLPLAYSAFSLLVPDIFIDTMGYPFTYPFIKLLFGSTRVPVGAYVHYPTISTDMLDSLPTDNASVKVKAKKSYWKMFALMYQACGASVDVVMANSSWTARHIRSLWPKHTISKGFPGGVKVVFPPCSVTEITSAIPITPATTTSRRPYILSIAQFRPEKRIDLLVRAFAHFRNTILPENSPLKKTVKLVLLGSTRDDDDATRVYKLRLLAHELGVKEQVEFVLDAPWADVLGWLGRSWIGVNTMWNEHFGIGVVEYLAAGLVAVVHDSGGPKEDIVVDGLGYHATDVESFACAFHRALSLPADEILQLRQRAQASSARFSEEVFTQAWLDALEELVDLAPPRKKFF